MDHHSAKRSSCEDYADPGRTSEPVGRCVGHARSEADVAGQRLGGPVDVLVIVVDVEGEA